MRDWVQVRWQPEEATELQTLQIGKVECNSGSEVEPFDMLGSVREILRHQVTMVA